MSHKNAIIKERERIANHIRKLARDMLRSKESSVADGYCAGILLDLAEAIQTEEKYDDHKI